MRSSRFVLAFLLVASAAAAPIARAAEGDGAAFFDEGRRLRKAGDCKGAIDQFRRALAAFPDGLGALRNLAECQEELGQVASARRSWSSLRRDALRLAEERYRGWDAEAAEAHQRLDARVPHLTVFVEASDPSKVIVSIDGEKLAPELVGTTLERDPGPHEITADGGGARVHESIALLEGERRELRLRVAVSEGVGDHPVKSGIGGAMIGAIASLSVAGLGVIGMGISAGLRQGSLADLIKACPSYADPGAVCPEAARDPVERGKRASTTFNVSAVVAGAGAVIGGTLLIVALTKSELKPAGAVWLSPIDGGATFGAAVQF